MSKLLRVITTIALIAASLPLLTAAGNGDDKGNDTSAEARAEHQRIIDFWTPERVARAVPRDFVRDPGGEFRPNAPGGNGGGKPDKPGKPPKGDEESGVVSGSSYTANTAIDGSTGKVLFAMDGSYFVCSATAIDDPGSNSVSAILTAAHCVFDEVNGEFATMWMFIPDYDADPEPLTTSGSFCGQTEHGCWTQSSMAVHTGYATAGDFNDQAVLYDFGVVTVGVGGRNSMLLEDVVTTQGTSFTNQQLDGSVTAWAFGYPAEKKWKGNDLIYCLGPVDGDPFNSNLTYRLNQCKLNGGSSGGGWLMGFDEATGVGEVFSVNSYGYTGVNAMHGPLLGPDTTAVYNKALSLLPGVDGTAS